MFNIFSHQKNVNKNLLYLSDWIKSITQVAAHAGEAVEQGLSSTTNGNANLYCHYVLGQSFYKLYKDESLFNLIF